jgi:hypothetical protein
MDNDRFIEKINRKMIDRMKKERKKKINMNFLTK